MINRYITSYLQVMFVFLCLFSSLSPGATLTTVNVEKQGERYILHIKARINADTNRIKQIITDYNNLTSINPSLKESNIISKKEEKRTTVSMLTDTCILFICYKIKHVQTFRLIENNIIYGRIIPKTSDFKHGWTRWTIKEELLDKKRTITELIFDAEMTPDFFILPVIGSYHLKKKMIEIATATINNLEKKAQNTLPY